jgi:hypothetical protein
MRFTCFASTSLSEGRVKEEAIRKIASIVMVMQEPTTHRLLKERLNAEFTRIYTSFYNSFTIRGNAVAYLWIGEVKTIFAYEALQKFTCRHASRSCIRAARQV